MANIGVTSLPNSYKSWANAQMARVENFYEKGKDYRPGIFYMNSTSNWEDRIGEIGGLTLPTVWQDGTTASQDSIKESYYQRFVQVPYGKEIPVGRLAQKFYQSDVNITNRASAQLGTVFYRLEQLAAFSMLAYGASTTNAFLTGVTGATVSGLGPDGKVMFAIDHPCSPSLATTWSNKLTIGVSRDALKAGFENLDAQRDTMGNLKHYGTNGVIWCVSRQWLPDALELIGSPERPDTADRAKNVYNGSFNGSSIEVREIPWLTDFAALDSTNMSKAANYHFMIAKDVAEMEMPLVYLTSQPFYTKSYVDNRTDTAYVRAAETFTVGFLSGRGMVGFFPA